MHQTGLLSNEVAEFGLTLVSLVESITRARVETAVGHERASFDNGGWRRVNRVGFMVNACSTRDRDSSCESVNGRNGIDQRTIPLLYVLTITPSFNNLDRRADK